jgi:hypothetical protein
VNTFEEGFADTQRAAGAVAKSANTLLSAARQLEKAAALGQISSLRKASDRLSVLLETVCQDVLNARSAWSFAVESEEGYLRNDFAREFAELAERAGLKVLRLDQGLAVFPSVLRIMPAERGVRIDGKKIHSVRPSKLIDILKKKQSKKPRFSSERFLEALYGAYLYLVGRDHLGEVVALAKVYQVFTLLPGMSSEYDQSDFARDLFLLDRSGLTATKSGAGLSLPASTGTKGGRGYSFASPDGEIVTFYGVRFTEGKNDRRNGAQGVADLHRT